MYVAGATAAPIGHAVHCREVGGLAIKHNMPMPLDNAKPDAIPETDYARSLNIALKAGRSTSWTTFL
jgi:hypothetical protein